MHVSRKSPIAYRDGVTRADVISEDEEIRAQNETPIEENEPYPGHWIMWMAKQYPGLWESSILEIHEWLHHRPSVERHICIQRHEADRRQEWWFTRAGDGTFQLEKFECDPQLDLSEGDTFSYYQPYRGMLPLLRLEYRMRRCIDRLRAKRDADNGDDPNDHSDFGFVNRHDEQGKALVKL